MIKNINDLADRLKGISVNGKEITAEDLSKFLTSEDEVEITVGKVNLLTDDELNEVKTTVSAGSKDSGFVDGMKSGAEQLVKAIRKSKGLEFEGKLKYGNEGKIDFDATAGHVSEHFEQKILEEAKIEPNKKIQELTESVRKIQKTYDTEKSIWDKDREKFNSTVESLKQDNFLEINLPKVGSLNSKQLMTLFRSEGNGVGFDENGEPFPTKHGKQVKDQMEKPVTFSTFAEEWIEKNSWGSKPPGRGADDDPPPPEKIFKNKNEAYAHMEKKGIDPDSPGGQKILESIGQE